MCLNDAMHDGNRRSRNFVYCDIAELERCGSRHRQEKQVATLSIQLQIVSQAQFNGSV